MICLVQAQHEIVVAKEDAGKRLDVVLAEALNLSRRYVHRLIGRGRVRLSGQPPSKGTPLRVGDRICVLPFRHPDEGPPATPELEIPVLHEQEGLVAVDKPAGLPTHPLDFEETHTVLNALLARYPSIRGIGEGRLRSGVVHRLDTHTSGVLLFATKEEAWSRARRAFSNRRVVKRYIARIHGELGQEKEITLRLDHRGPRMRVVEKGGHEAITRVRPLQRIGDTSLVEVEPLTGLMHQIRASLAHLGHPILGDPVYGSAMDLGRHLLHATFISLRGFEAASPLPAVFTA